MRPPVPPARARFWSWSSLILRAVRTLTPLSVVCLVACFDPYFQAHDLARDGEQDGVVIQDDCDDDDPFVTFTVYNTDGDLDGYGVPGTPVTGCERPEGYAENDDDCDDTDPNLWFESWWYQDLDLDGYGTGEPTWRCAGYGTSLIDGDCFDGDASVHPDAEEVCDGLPYDACAGQDGCATKDQNCDGLSDCEAPTGIVDPNDMSGRFAGSAEAELGTSVHGAGDVNGDGFDDLLVGAPGLTNADGEIVGGAALLHGPPPETWSNGESTEGVLSLLGKDADGRAGEAVTTAGDVDGDGYADILIGAPQAGGSGGAVGFPMAPPAAGGVDWDPGSGGLGSEEGAGYAYFVEGPVVGDVVLGSTFGTATLKGTDSGDRAGQTLAGLGDLDEDGFEDFLIGAPLASVDGDSEVGIAYVLTGPLADDGDLVELAWLTISGDAEGDHLGTSASGLGDLDGDGRGDLVLGAPTDVWETSGRSPITATYTGSIYVIYAPDAGSLAANEVSQITLTGAASDALGARVEGLGDVDGDGAPDLGVGAPLASSGGLEEAGALYIYSGLALVEAERAGSALDDALLATILGDEAEQQLGATFAGGGDLNGDLFADLVLGDPTADADTGAVYVLYAPLEGVDSVGDAALVVQGSVSGGRLGCSVAIAGDLNGLGWPDVALGRTRERGEDDTADSGYAYALFMDGL